jgi:MerR family transcriptional regulator, light-induced transcriptional regulator
MNLHKIGAVSSLSGVPTPTLRIWEARYQCFSPLKTASRHRLYSDDDVLKATLMKRLTEQGHSVSQIAQSSLQELNQLLQQHQGLGTKGSEANRSAPFATVAIVGLPLASRVESKKFTEQLGPTQLRITDIFGTPEEMLQAQLQEQPELLLIQCHSLHAGVQVEIRRLADKSQASHVIVLYSFGQAPVIESLKQWGMIVRREPLPETELSELLLATLRVDLPTTTNQGTLHAAIPPRKYDDMALLRVTGISSQVLCECPQHVAELITQLARFEQYSLDCLNKSTEDARIHAQLSAISGTARAMFEDALEMVAQHEGIDLQTLRN